MVFLNNFSDSGKQYHRKSNLEVFKLADKKVLITRDSTSDLPPELVEELNIKTIPLVVNLGDNSYQDGIDITPDDIYKYHQFGQPVHIHSSSVS